MKLLLITSLCTLALLASAAEDESHWSAGARLVSKFVSPSGKLLVELRGASSTAHSVWIAPAGKPDRGACLFQDEGDLGVIDVKVSGDDRLIAVLWGGASYGHHVVLYLRAKDGHYQRRHADLSDLAWQWWSKEQSFPRSLTPAHLYTSDLMANSTPLSLDFQFGGNWFTDGRHEFGPVSLRYLVKEGKIITPPLRQ